MVEGILGQINTLKKGISTSSWKKSASDDSTMQA